MTSSDWADWLDWWMRGDYLPSWLPAGELTGNNRVIASLVLTVVIVMVPIIWLAKWCAR